jgi:hypothetical protein
MHTEFKLAYVTVIFLFGVVMTAQLLRDNFSMGVTGTAMLLLGGFLISFGFWGADYAFSVKKGRVYVPFLGNYTPAEWWNLNWFLVAVGAFCVGLGGYFVGILLGRMGL